MTCFRASGGFRATFEIVKGAVWTVSLWKLTERVIHALSPKRHSTSDTTLRALVDNNLSVVREHHCWGFWLKLARTFWSCELTATAKKKVFEHFSVFNMQSHRVDKKFYCAMTNCNRANKKDDAMILKKLQFEPLHWKQVNEMLQNISDRYKKQNGIKRFWNGSTNSVSSFSPTMR